MRVKILCLRCIRLIHVSSCVQLLNKEMIHRGVWNKKEVRPSWRVYAGAGPGLERLRAPILKITDTIFWVLHPSLGRGCAPTLQLAIYLTHFRFFSFFCFSGQISIHRCTHQNKILDPPLLWNSLSLNDKRLKTRLTTLLLAPPQYFEWTTTLTLATWIGKYFTDLNKSCQSLPIVIQNVFITKILG